jgi:hypothetical protein
VAVCMLSYNRFFSPAEQAVAAYRMEVHDEEDGEGRKRRPYFPGVSDGTVTIRPLRDTPEDLARLAGWLTTENLTDIRGDFIVNLDEFEVPCMIEVDGAPAGYLQYAHLPEQPGTYRISRLLGPGCDAQTLRPLIAYLYEWEEAAQIVCPGINTARPDDGRFHLLH